MDGSLIWRRRPKASANDTLVVATNSPVYDHARRDWSNRLKEANKQRNVAFGLAFGGMVAAVAASGLAYKSAQPRIETVVVEVNSLGDAVTTAIAPVRRPMDPVVARYQIAEFIRNLRMVVSDPAAARRNVDALFAMLPQPSPAAATIGEWFGSGDNRPMVRSAKELVTVEIQTVTVIGDQAAGNKTLEGGRTWRVEWLETATGRDGRLHYRRTYVATLVTDTTAPTTVASAMKNPTGLFVKEISVSERGGRTSE